MPKKSKTSKNDIKPNPAKKGFIRRLLFNPAGVTMGLEERTTIAQQEDEREGHVPRQPPPRRRAGLTQPREGGTRPPPVPTAEVAASRRGGPSGTTRAPHSGDGEQE